MDEQWKDLIGRYYASMLKQQMDWFNSPIQRAYREECDRKWKAKPRYERAWIRTTAKVGQWRVRLGEIVAGRRFDD